MSCVYFGFVCLPETKCKNVTPVCEMGDDDNFCKEKIVNNLIWNWKICCCFLWKKVCSLFYCKDSIIKIDRFEKKNTKSFARWIFIFFNWSRINFFLYLRLSRPIVVTHLQSWTGYAYIHIAWTLVENIYFLHHNKLESNYAMTDSGSVIRIETIQIIWCESFPLIVKSTILFCFW